MKSVVVYESLWGNTAAVARAVAEGLGEGAVALSTADAAGEAISGADLVVAGAPLLGFSLPTEQMRATIAADPKYKPRPDTAAPSLRAWIAGLPAGAVPFATFETRLWWSPGSAAGGAAKLLEEKGYRRVGEPLKALVKGTYGPLKDGELNRARAWGASLRTAVAG